MGAAIGALIIRGIIAFKFFNELGNGGIQNLKYYPVISTIIILLFAIIFYIISPKVLRIVNGLVGKVESDLQDKSLGEMLWGILGLVIGLFLAFLITIPLYKLDIPYLGPILSILIYIVLAYLGIRVATRRKEEFSTRIHENPMILNRLNSKDKSKSKGKSLHKILDTSVIIDGRISDICNVGFVEGPLVIPVFVLEELQHIADSSDGLKRNRGRRGLDILKIMQDNPKLEIIIHEEKYEDIEEVDSKLLKLTKDLKGKIITNDYNLNKVADVQGIEVLNINELANAVKPVVLPGEEMVIQVVKDGKEHGQGLAYLDDGTMIVVESGKNYIGKTIEVIVTSVLQTSAGKMIFAKPRS